MVALWKSLTKAEAVRVVAPDGSLRCETQAYFAGDTVIVDDMTADMEPGDELRRTLPNGKDDVYRIVGSTLYDTDLMPAHYQIKVTRKGTFNHDEGGYRISIQGPNARVNIQSTDNSTNVVNSGDVFGELRNAIERGVGDQTKRSEIIAAIDEAEQAKGSAGFLAAYQKVISVAADHVGLLGPFLPALTALII